MTREVLHEEARDSLTLNVDRSERIVVIQASASEMQVVIGQPGQDDRSVDPGTVWNVPKGLHAPTLEGGNTANEMVIVFLK